MPKGLTPKTVNILGIPLHNVDTTDTLEIIRGFIEEGGQHKICIPNVDVIMQAQKNPDLFQILNQAQLSVPDGMGVVYASRFLGTPLKENVKGRILTVHICQQASERGHSVFLMGSEPGVAAQAAEVLKTQFPHLKVAGTLAPPFGFDQNQSENNVVIEKLRQAKPDILFVGLGAPKQEKWIANHLSKTEIPVALGVGCTFDVISGKIKEAPSWMTEVGLEWLFRLTREPGRLWMRYLVRDPQFIWKVILQKLRKNVKPTFAE